MKFLKNLWENPLRRKKHPLVMDDSKLAHDLSLLKEIEDARKDWEIAKLKLDYVVEKDQIDYAIYAMEAAEKRYEMLIRAAKRQNLNRWDLEREREQA